MTQVPITKPIIDKDLANIIKNYLYDDLIKTFSKFTSINEINLSNQITQNNINVVLHRKENGLFFELLLNKQNICQSFHNGYYAISVLCDSFCKHWNDLANNYIFDDTKRGRYIFRQKNYSEPQQYVILFSGISQTLNKYILDTLRLPDPNMITALSGRSYERKPCSGVIAVSNHQSNHIRYVVKFTEKIVLSFENLRQCRKILEATTNEQYAYMIKEDGEWIIKGYIEAKSSSILTRFKLNKNSSWDLIVPYKIPNTSIVREQNALEYKDGLLGFPSEKKLNDIEFMNKISEVTKSSSKKKRLLKIAQAAESLGHGTTVIFTNDNAEIDRLKEFQRGTNISSMSLFSGRKCNENLIKSLCSIDGALIVNANGVCCCYGVILDGEAVIPGDPSTGSRHNSVNNYIVWKKKSSRSVRLGYVAVVVSDDDYTELYS